MALEAKRQQITKHKHNASHFYFYFCPKLEFKTYFVYFHTFSYKFKVQRTPTEFRLPVALPTCAILIPFWLQITLGQNVF